MATVKQVVRVCDWHPDDPAVDTATFRVNGKRYEVDVCGSCLSDLTHTARLVKPKANGQQRGVSRARMSSLHGERVRQWGRDNGFTVGSHGRLSADLIAAYKARDK